MNLNKDNIYSLLLIGILFFMIVFVTHIQNPMGVALNRYTSSNLFSQLGLFSIYIAYIVMGIPSGILLSRLGYRKMIILSSIIGIIAFFIMSVGCYFMEKTSVLNLFIYLVGVFISGCCVCMLNTIVNPFANNLGGGGNKGNQLIQFGTFVAAIAAIIIPVLCGYFLNSNNPISIKNCIPIFIFEIIIFIIILILIYFKNIDEFDKLNVSNDKINRFGALRYPHFIFGIIAIFCYIGIEVGIPSMCNLFLVNEIGLETIVAGSIVSIFYVFMIFGRLGGFLFGSKISSHSMLKYGSVASIILILIAFISSSYITFPFPIINFNFSFEIIYLPIRVLFFIIIGLFISVMWGTIFNLAVEGLGQYTEHASGIFMIMLCGGGILPIIQGGILDITGSFSYVAILILVLFIYIFWYSVKGYKYGKNI